MAAAGPLAGGVGALLLLIALCSGQTCETFNGDPVYCAPLIKYPVYLPPGVTQAMLASNISALTNSYSLIPEPCRTATVKLVCSSTFRSCINDTTSNTLMPEILCRGLCTDYNTNCKGLIDSKLAPAEDCAKPDPLAPLETLYVPAGQTQTCVAANTSNNAVGVSCKDPFVYNPVAKACAISCPPPSFDDPTWQRRWQVGGLVTLSISIVLEALLMVTWVAIYNPDRPYYVYQFVLSIMLINFGTWIGKWLPYAKWMCETPWKVRDQSNAAVAFAGLLNIYGSIAASTWMLLLLYHLVNLLWEGRFQVFGGNRLIWFVRPNTAYNWIGWVVAPLPITIIAFAGEWVGMYSGWIAYPNGQPRGGWVFYGLIFLPLTILQTLQWILIALLFYRIITVSGKAGLIAQARLTILSLYYIFAIGYSIYYGWYVMAHRQDLINDITNYITCKLGTSPDLCKRLEFNGGWPAYIAMYFNTTLGIGIFLILNDSRLRSLWWRWITLKGFYLADTHRSTVLEMTGSASNT